MSGIRPVIHGPALEEDGLLTLVSRCLSAAGIRFSAILSRLVFRPSYDRPTGTRCRTMTGFPRSAHTRCGRIGRPLYPGTCGALPGRDLSPPRRPPPFHGTGPVTPVPPSPTRGCHLRGICQGFTSFARPAFPSPAAPDDTGTAQASSLGSAPARAGPAHARQGRDRLRARAWNTATSTTSCWPSNQRDSLAHVRPRVALTSWHCLLRQYQELKGSALGFACSMIVNSTGRI